MSPLKQSTNIAARMGRWSARHRKTAIFGWLAFVVASFAIGGAGAANAALFAVRILALTDNALGRVLEKHRKAGAKKVLDANARLRAR